MTRNQIAAVVVAVVLSVSGAVGLGAWLASGDEAPRAARVERRVARLDADDVADRAARRTVPPAVRRKVPLEAPSTLPGARRGGAARREVNPEERFNQREDTLARRSELLEQYGASRGWDDRTVDEVDRILTDTTDYVSGIMARAEAGEDFADMRGEVQVFRRQQTMALRAIVGDEEFPAFIEAVQLQRLFGDGTPGGAGGERAGERRAGGGRRSR